MKKQRVKRSTTKMVRRVNFLKLTLSKGNKLLISKNGSYWYERGTRLEYGRITDDEQIENKPCQHLHQ